MTVEYKPQEGYAQFTFDSNDAAVGFTQPYNRIQVRRQYVDTYHQQYKVLNVDIADTSDYSYTFRDYYCAPNMRLRYVIVPYMNNSQTENLSVSSSWITTAQEGVMISDGTTYYYSDLDVEVNATRQYAVAYVQPYYARTPHAIHNGNLNYYKGSCSALWLPKDANGEYTKVGCNEYKQGFMDWLTDGNPKLLKTRQGQMWMISIDEEVTNFDDDFIDDGKVSFNWTEIDDVPTTQGIVVVT